MDVSQYLEIFIDETKEHLQTLSDQLMILEQEPENMETINEIFRAAHSLKGMAGTMGYKRMQRLTHDMENVFQEIRSGNMKVQPELVDVLFRGLDALEGYLANILDSADEGTEENQDIINALNDIAAKRGQKLSQMALAWCLHNEAVTTVLVGASSPKQLADNVECIRNLDFTKEECDAIDAIVQE